jgi:hypothetical protein
MWITILPSLSPIAERKIRAAIIILPVHFRRMKSYLAFYDKNAD